MTFSCVFSDKNHDHHGGDHDHALNTSQSLIQLPLRIHWSHESAGRSRHHSVTDPVFPFRARYHGIADNNQSKLMIARPLAGQHYIPDT